MNRDDLLHELNQLLKPHLFKDYCPNGLQVEGKSEIKKVVTGVTASQALIDQAIEVQADAILVHHGYFWKNEPEVIVGVKQQRIKKLLAHDINLIAYHLPLDAHRDLGNNKQLANILNINNPESIKPDSLTELLWCGDIPEQSVAEFAQYITQCLGRTPMHIGDKNMEIKTVAWCTGGAQNYLEQAAQLGVDAFISGEVSEATFHLANEYGIHYFAAGHHATERYGIKALGEYIGQIFNLDVQFIDLYNPI